MVKELNIFGNWFLPNAPNTKVSGKLKFNPFSGIELEIFGYFGLPFTFEKIPIILGKTNEGLITLIDSSFREKSSEYSRSKSIFIIKGRHFNTVDEIKFNISRSKIRGLSSFMKIKGLEFDRTKSTNNLKINYIPSKPVKFEIKNRFKGEIYSNAIGRFDSFSKITLVEDVFYKLNYSSPTFFKDLIKDIGKFKGLINLCNNDTSYSTKIQLKNTNDNKYCEIIYQNTYYQEMTSDNPISIITYKDINRNFEEILQNWYDLFDKYSHILNLRLFHYSNKNFYTVDRFIDMTRSIESFHRLLRNNKRFPQGEYDEFLKSIKLIEINSKFKQLLNDRLNYGNEPTFKTRLNEILGELPKSLTNIFDTNNKFSKIVKDARNYYTHYGDELKPKIPVDFKLVRLTENLEAVISFVLLKEIGIEEAILEKSFRNKYIFSKYN